MASETSTPAAIEHAGGQDPDGLVVGAAVVVDAAEREADVERAAQDRSAGPGGAGVHGVVLGEGAQAHLRQDARTGLLGGCREAP